MMAKLQLIIAILEFIFISVSAKIKCPASCSCPLDDTGRWQVLCLEGGLGDPLPVLEMPSEVEVLIVSAPKEKPNTLTLGPIFRELQSLEEIHVTNSKVPALGEHSFWGLRKLYVLNISHNAINLLRETNFRGPDALRVLDLSHNFIESVPSAVFRYLKLLRGLDLSHNRIPELASRVFFGLPLLERLDLSYNPLGGLNHDRFSDLPALKSFKCGGCGLLTITESFVKELKVIEHLDLSNNRLTTVPPLQLALKLVTFQMNGNLLSKISKTDLKGPTTLQELDLSHNRLTSIEDGTFENSSLTVLDLSYNRLSYLSPLVLEPIIASLKAVSFSGNSLHIDQLTEILPKARQLRQLGIGDLGLTRIPSDLLRRSRNLRQLNISSNYLSKFPHELLYSTPNLQSLDLSANSFRGLTQNVIAAFSAMSSLVNVRLERNPWQCQDCYISFVLEWLKSSPKQTHSVVSCQQDPSSLLCLKCVGPEKLAGHAMILLKEDKLVSCTSAAQTSWPEWHEGQNEIIMSDDPRSSINKRNGVGDTRHFKIVAAFFKDHLALLVGIVCGLVLAIMLVVVTALICSRRQSAYYYTSEEDIEKREKLVGRNNNDSPVSSPTTLEPLNKIPPYEPMAILKVHSKTPIVPCSTRLVDRPPITACLSSKRRPAIATIDEITVLDNSS